MCVCVYCVLGVCVNVCVLVAAGTGAGAGAEPMLSINDDAAHFLCIDA